MVIATPIGNLSDLSERAAEAIRSCDLLLCEDTRVTRKLVTHLGAGVDLASHHEHNEQGQVESLIERMERGAAIGLVSDAGTPLISDPGFPLVRAARERGIRVEPIPGPSAGLAALSASGIAPVPFCFLGFLPRKSAERRELFRSLQSLRMTAVAFESPHRLEKSLVDLEQELGEIEISVARELTKMHEEILTGTVEEVRRDLESKPRIRGEITIVISAPSPRSGEFSMPDPEQLRQEFEALRSSGMKRTDAVKVLAERYGLPRRELYDKLAEV
ncbi:MAG: 16S rRNA (cytidine(1402)-2'-O)-methyltransferase [Thermoanaerobaculia bacterium]|nr:16S rRNA (cytidine(1402)-2'-O)-methyltransferase [Thermoanaerobaculia bacterium]